MESSLTTQNLSVGYQGIALVEEIEMSLSKGEIITLIGANGAGKTTLLKTIASQVKLVKGEVCLNQAPVVSYNEKELAKKIAIVFTKRISMEYMTVWEVVSLGRYPYTDGFGRLKSHDRKIIEDSMELVEITGLKDKEFQYLSDGQKQRVLLARAICQEPEFLLLDEPTSFLDVKYKLDFFSILQKMTRKKQMGVLMSLHELDLAERISDKIICVHNNKIERYGAPQDIFCDGFIKRIYQITRGTFDESNGGVELERVQGKSEVFVIAGNDTGKSIYRKLQREGIPFTTGILSENDLDYPCANALANTVISVKAYEPFTKEDYERAKKELKSCKKLICCIKEFGTLNKWNEELLKEAKNAGIPVEIL